MIYKLKKGTKGKCHSIDTCHRCLAKILGRPCDDIYVEELPNEAVRFVFVKYGFSCTNIRRSQLVPVNTRRRKAEFLIFLL
jgi:hypothetical protein